MALIRCSECGKEISDNAYMCPNCGNPLKDIPVYPLIKRKIPGRGFGIAGMVLGIIGAVYCIPLFVLLTAKDGNLSAVTNIGMSIEIAIFGILAIVFGFVSRHKGHKRGKSLAALILGFLTLCSCAAVIIATVLML